MRAPVRIDTTLELVTCAVFMTLSALASSGETSAYSSTPSVSYRCPRANL
jgi:hypothetical protein